MSSETTASPGDEGGISDALLYALIGVGGVVVIAVIILIVWCCIKKVKKKRTYEGLLCGFVILILFIYQVKVFTCVKHHFENLFKIICVSARGGSRALALRES